ncbi:uncharacterized protein LOC124138078 [Haliotis rufescens]|uniref:uncharacterized protein LOC124138078 n=1 Tax=Haliotis rufescens TaxID=6454 RepID=UPI001EB06DDC|nr:uncharacterized protein LOC124138078 [Haliotis rufescens]
MCKPHQLFTVNKSLTMCGRVVFLLYLPAICFSFAVLSNDGIGTQRRQNPDEIDENWVNTTIVSEVGDPCLTQLEPCLNLFQPLQRLDGPQDLVVDGDLNIPCGSHIQEEIRDCLDDNSGCKDNMFYMLIQVSQQAWDFICQHSQGFIAGEACWASSDFHTTIAGCGNSSQQEVCMPTCIRDVVAKIPACTADDASLLGNLSTVSEAMIPNSSC